MFSTFEKLLDRQLSIIDKMARGKTRNRRLTGVVIIWSFLKKEPLQAFDLCSLQQQKDCEWSLLSWQMTVF